LNYYYYFLARYADINRAYGRISGYVGGNGNNKQFTRKGHHLLGGSRKWVPNENTRKP
jgi:hypothetical protein